MNIEILLYIIILFAATIGFFFSALNRKRSINEDTFIRKVTYQLKVTKNDKIDIPGYKNLYFLSTIITSVLFLIVLVLSIIVLKGSVRDISSEQIEVVTLLANFAILVFLSRINIVNYIKEKYVTRQNKEKKSHHEISYIALNTAFLVAFLYNLVMYII